MAIHFTAINCTRPRPLQYDYGFPPYLYHIATAWVIWTVWWPRELLRCVVLCGNVFVLLITNPEELLLADIIESELTHIYSVQIWLDILIPAALMVWLQET
jgi:hypothetical protein